MELRGETKRNSNFRSHPSQILFLTVKWIVTSQTGYDCHGDGSKNSCNLIFAGLIFFMCFHKSK